MPLYLGDKLIAGQSRPVDATPVDGSTNLVSSGGVKKYVDENLEGLGAEIPIQDTAPIEGDLWIDTSDDGATITPEQLGVYTKSETDAAIQEALSTFDPGDSLPEVSAADNGKFLRVVGGVWAAAVVENAEEVGF